MLIFPTKYADVFLIRRYTLVINYLQGKLPILGYPLLDGRQSAPV